MLFEGLLDLLFPAACLGCEGPIPRPGFCPACAPRPREVSTCIRCDDTLRPGPGHRCGRCLRRPPKFARAWGVYDYADATAEALRRAKYRRQPEAMFALADRCATHLPGAILAELPDLVVPVPLHPRRWKQRSFSPPLILAHRVARALGRPLDRHLMRRTRDTPVQVAMDEPARRRNVRGAFASKPCSGHLLLVDDVLTTGATTNEAAKALLQAGATSVRVLAAARVSVMMRP